MTPEEQKKPWIHKLRHQETIRKGPKIFRPEKGKGSYQREKEKYVELSTNIRKLAFMARLAGLVDHAESELKKAGLFDKDSDYNGAIGKAVMELCETFSKQGHSGFSADCTLDLFDKVARFRTLTPITADSSEWSDVSDMNGSPMWQNKRDSRFFSKDGGKTWYTV